MYNFMGTQQEENCVSNGSNVTIVTSAQSPF